MSTLRALRAAQRSLVQASVDVLPVDLCGPCLQVLPVDGAAVSLLTGTMRHETVCASDPVAERIDELQFDLGEGPCWQAMDSGRAVLVPDVRGAQHPAWPLFGAAARGTDARAIFAFPVRMSGIELGALDLYNTAAGPLPADVVHAAGVLADTLAWVLMRYVLQDAESTASSGVGSEAGYGRVAAVARREVHQAVGMVLAQIGLQATPQGAFSLLRARAFAEDRPVIAVARDVLARRLTFG